MLDTNYDIFKVDAYPDAEFTGIYRSENPDDTACAKSRTGFIIASYDFPVLWISIFQTETALLKMEVETIAITPCFLELFTIIDIN